MASRPRERDVEGAEPARVDDHRVLAHEAADARHLGHALGLGDGEAHLPVLRRAQLGERALGRHDGVLVDPPDASRVGAERGTTPAGSVRVAAERYSSTRERAQ